MMKAELILSCSCNVNILILLRDQVNDWSRLCLFKGAASGNSVTNQTLSARQVTTVTETMSANQIEAVVCNVDDLKNGE